MIRVLLVDDDALVREGVRLIIENQADLTVVDEAADGHAALRMVEQHEPDVALVDIRMPGMTGIELTRRLCARSTARPAVVVLTTFDEDEYVFEALASGAIGFLLKSGPAQHLLTAIRMAADGDVLLAPAVTKRLIARHLDERARQSHGPNVPALSTRERDVLRCISQGLSNAEIGRQLYLSESTVKTHVNRLLAKLGVRDRLQAAVLAHTTRLFE